MWLAVWLVCAGCCVEASLLAGGGLVRLNGGDNGPGFAIAGALILIALSLAAVAVGFGAQWFMHRRRGWTDLDRAQEDAGLALLVSVPCSLACLAGNLGLLSTLPALGIHPTATHAIAAVICVMLALLLKPRPGPSPHETA